MWEFWKLKIAAPKALNAGCCFPVCNLNSNAKLDSHLSLQLTKIQYDILPIVWDLWMFSVRFPPTPIPGILLILDNNFLIRRFIFLLPPQLHHCAALTPQCSSASFMFIGQLPANSRGCFCQNNLCSYFRQDFPPKQLLHSLKLFKLIILFLSKS